MISILVSLALLTATDAVPATEGLDVAAASTWVKLVDAKQWTASWNSAGALFKSRMPEARWASTVEPVRAPLGEVSSRSLKGITKASSLPGAPDGEYEMVHFQTSFAHKAAADETIVLAREGPGWKVDGYFIR